MPDLLLNDISARSLGLIVGDISGWRDAPDRQTPTAAVPPNPGVVALSTPREQPRVLTVRGHLRGTSKADVLAKADTLNFLCQGVSTKLAMPDELSRHIYATMERLAYPTIPGHFGSFSHDYPVELRFTAQKPYFLSDSLTSLGGGVDLPLGTGLVQPSLSLTGAAVTGITLTLRDETNTAVTTMSFPTLVLTAPDVLVVDCAAKTAKKNGTNVLADLDAATDFFTIDPQVHADYGASLWPDITTSAGTLTVSYRKTWR